ncbi:beta-galactosidase [bacterium]|nr:beta-galactosidase [bacterium]
MKIRAILIPLLLTIAASRLPAQQNLRRVKPGYSDFDTQSFLLDGKRVLHLSAEVAYFRLPRDEWADRLLQTRLAGFNMVETAVPWSLHEPVQGQFTASGQADLAAFLDLCHRLKLRVFLRIGPFVGTTMSNGGLPAWLGNDRKLMVRTGRGAFLTHVRAYWDKLLPLVASRQIPKGPVTLVQVEDHYRGQDKSYLSRLASDAAARGIETPIILSEWNASKDFLQTTIRKNTLYFTSELLPAPPLKWGESFQPARHFEGVLFEGIARGIDGYNLALWTAGTHFAVLPGSAYPNRYESSTSGILEGGARSPVYTAAKQVNLFAQTFEKALTHSQRLLVAPFVDPALLRTTTVHARTDGKTTLLFLRPRYGSRKIHVPDPDTGETFSLPADARYPVHLVAKYPLSAKTTLAVSSAQILTIQKQSDRILIVAYAPADSTAKMVFRTSKKPDYRVGAENLAWNAAKKQTVLTWKHRSSKERADFVLADDTPIHVVAVDVDALATTWAIEGVGVILGAPGVGPCRAGSSIELRFPAARRAYAVRYYPHTGSPSPAPNPSISDPKFDAASRCLDFKVGMPADRPTPRSLTTWEFADVGAEISPTFNDSSWADSLKPLPMGEAHYGWYRCTFQMARAQRRKLRFANIADQGTVYLNGEHVGTTAMKRPSDGPRKYPHTAQFDLAVREGANVLAILVKNGGRYRNSGVYAQNLTSVSGWGILGAVTLDTRVLTNWRQSERLDPAKRTFAWGPVPEQGPLLRWYRTSFKTPEHPAHLAPRLVLKGLGYGAAWVNGQFVGLYQQDRYDAGRGVCVPTHLLRPDNEIILLEEAGRVPDRAQVSFDRHASDVRLKVDLQ